MSWWLEEAGAVAPREPLTGDARADVVVIGGGYTGLWTAWQLARRGAEAVVLEAGLCGHGPSGRNGGFVQSLWPSWEPLRALVGEVRARAVVDASAESVGAIGDWCAEQGVDAWFRRAGQLVVATAPAQDAAVADMAGAVALDVREVRARCASPLFRGGALYPADATVQPARLALALRERVTAFEGSRVVRLREDAGGVEASTSGGRVRASHAVLAVNAAARAVGPLRPRLAVASSHISLTEPVPDVLEAIGWTGGEAVSDARTFLHYLRTTPGGRIAFGWAGGRIACGARLGGRIDHDPAVLAAIERRAVATFPALAGRRFTHGWGGPIDVSPDHVPRIGMLGARTSYAAGFTGNGVGPAHLAGRILASLALDARDEMTALAIVEPPPVRVPGEPAAWLGGTVVRAATLRRERLEEAGRAVDALTRVACAAPAALGLHMGRG